MFTLFDLFQLLGLIIGAATGAIYGAHWYGWIGCLVGVPLGLALGFVCGRIPFVAALFWLRSDLTSMSTEHIRSKFQGGPYPAYHLFLRELLRRGESIHEEIPVVLSLLGSASKDQRHHGWYILRSFFSELAAAIPDYDPGASTEICQANVQKLSSALD
ncbi:MAG TPA: hypothetical protein VNA25_25770 [Phycisphaerae bacterium]|nr:hypothetical protein [Phycisphaerae bacterium]